ncbi:MAG: hypothetical protein IJ879_04745, partial [Muribaculaceae bacterium]|nr:hypothetical protein [Muribaculaceae bacterium]
SPGHRRWHDAAYWVVLLAACVVMYVMNTLTPFKEDDMAYSVIPSGSLREFCSSLVDHFMTTNGRFADVVANLFCAVLGKPVFNLCNALVFGLMAHLVALLSAGRRSLMALTLFLAVVGVCYPVPGETMLWVAGSCNYLWAVTASLALIYYLLNHKDGPLGWGRAALLLLGAFVAGNFNEATSFGVFAGLFLYYAFNRRKVDRRVVIAMVGYLLGVVMIVASPGAWSRMAEESGEANSGFIGLLSSHWYIFNEKMWRFYTPLTACAAGLVVLLSKGFGMVRRSMWTYLFVCLVLFMFAMGFRVINERAYAALVTVGFIITARTACWLLSRWPWARMAVAAGALAMSAYATVHAYGPVKAYKAFEDGVVSDIVKAPREAVLLERRFDGYSRFVFPLRFVSSETFMRENVYCAYYDKDNVQFVSDSVYARYHQGRLLDGAVEAPVKTDRPDIVNTMLMIPGQEYMVITLNVDTMPFTSQQASYVVSALSQEEMEFRNNYGLFTDHTPQGFYPLRYQDRLLLIFPSVSDSVEHIEFPIDNLEPPTQVTLHLKQ